MGLDMYLKKKTWVGNQYKSPEEQIKIDIPKVQQSRVSEVVETVGYWRKANAIHAWIVKNVQKGEDDGKEYYIEKAHLEALLETVEKVLATETDGQIDDVVAEELLPTQGGFFFGSTEYDSGYVDDLKLTKKIVEEVLKEYNQQLAEDICELYYRASW